MRKTVGTVALAAILLAGGTLAGCTATSHGSTSPSSNASSGSGSAVLPVSSNPISNTSTAPGLSITYSAVEDNVDPKTNAAMADSLELTLKNSTSADLTRVEVYYTMTDTTTKASESYYSDLAGLVLPAGKETTIWFDNTGQPNHFPENRFSLYRSSTNQVDFTIEVSANGVKPATATAKKSVGTGEVPGE